MERRVFKLGINKQDLLCNIIKQTTDNTVLDKVEAVLAENQIIKLIDEINADRNDSFSDNDKEKIRIAVVEAPGPLAEKINFLEICRDKGYIDMGALLRDASTKVVSLESAASTRTDQVFNYITKQLAGKGGGGFNLGSGAAVGPGEGWFILVCKGVTKGKVGDLMYNNGDVELKANAARWHTARAQYGAIRGAFNFSHNILKSKGINISESTYKTSVDFRSGNFITKDKVEKMGVSAEDFVNAWADAFADVLPRGADVSFVRDASWLGDSMKFRAAYSAAIASAYQTADGWEYILQYNYEKKTVTACKNGEDVYKAIIGGRLKATPTPDGNFLGGSDSRSMSPNFDVGAV